MKASQLLSRFKRHLSHAVLLREVRRLQRKENRFGRIPETGEYLRDGKTCGSPVSDNGTSITLTQAGSFILIYGVWVELSLDYEARGIPIVKPPIQGIRDLAPGIPDSVLGCCLCCSISWKWVKGHSTYYKESSGVFPLCEKCWSSLTPEDRLPYYEELIAQWHHQGCPVDDDKESRIRDACLAGL
jgi:hypothetical protein